MKIHQITQILEVWAPLHYAEDFDNVGLLVGNPNDEASGILVTHDCLEEVVDEAIGKDCNLIVCFHPILVFLVTACMELATTMLTQCVQPKT